MKKINLKGIIVDDAKFMNKNENMLRFTLAVKERYDNNLRKYLYRLVPCVIFEPDEKIVKSLINNGDGLEIECEGIKSKITNKNGTSEKVILTDPDYLTIIK